MKPWVNAAFLTFASDPETDVYVFHDVNDCFAPQVGRQQNCVISRKLTSPLWQSARSVLVTPAQGLGS
jgi:hypothetical protein